MIHLPPVGHPPTAPPDPPPMAADDAAREIVSLVLDADLDAVASAQALAGTLTVVQLRRIERALASARTLVIEAAAAAGLTIWEG